MINKKIHFSASLACADFKNLGMEITELEKAGIDFFHFDICDGHFAPTFLLSPIIMSSLRSLTNLRFDAHLYCNYPSRYIDELSLSGADMIIVHIESNEDYRVVVNKIRSKGLKAGLAILPDTEIPGDIVEIFPFISLFIANTVGPAYAGQPFNPNGLDNLKKISEIISNKSTGSGDFAMETGVDGGVNLDSVNGILNSGANHLVLGSTGIFKKDKDYGKELKLLSDRINAISGCN
jgi:ribulose-phosphate 3-epimerase